MSSRRTDYREASAALICVDGITQGLIKGVTADVTWHTYVNWLRQRRPALQVIHLRQHYDWVQIVSGPPDQYGQLEEEMLETLRSEVGDRIKHVVVFGYSLGGLTALHLSNHLSQRIADFSVEYVAYVSFGTPFHGTGRIHDYVLRHVSRDYFQYMLDSERTAVQLHGFLELARQFPIRILLGEIERDELVSTASSLRPVHWLTNWSLPEQLKWGTFLIKCGNPLQAHHGLLTDPLAISYIDGLVDGLLPPDQPNPYNPIR